MNIRQELKSLDEKLQKLRGLYYRTDKKLEAEYLDLIYSRLQDSFIRLEVDIEQANLYFVNLLKEEK